MTTKRKTPPPPEPLQVINVGDAAFIKARLQAKRPGHRCPSPIERTLALLRPAMRVVELEAVGLQRKAAIAQAAAELHCTTRKVEKSLRDCGLTRPRKK